MNYERIPRLSFDIDGVCADIAGGLLDLVNAKYGTEFKTEDWDNYYAPSCLTRDQYEWSLVQMLETSMFWVGLDVYDRAALPALDRRIRAGELNAFFVTSRKDIHGQFGDAQRQTEMWLSNHGMLHASGTVVGWVDRPALLKLLQIDAHLDDIVENFTAINAAGIPCYLMDQPWNRNFDAQGRRVYTLDQFVTRAIQDNSQESIQWTIV